MHRIPKLRLATTLLASLIASATPALAAESEHDTAERRLRACLVSASSGAPRASLVEAVSAVRAVCTPQITKLRKIRVDEATAGLSGRDAERVAKRTERALNDEIALAIANFTGLTP